MCRHGEDELCLVSLAQHTGVSRVTVAAPPYSQRALGLFTPEGITINKLTFNWIQLAAVEEAAR
jgi:hypothetical protein